MAYLLMKSKPLQDLGTIRIYLEGDEENTKDLLKFIETKKGDPRKIKRVSELKAKMIALGDM